MNIKSSYIKRQLQMKTLRILYCICLLYLFLLSTYYLVDYLRFYLTFNLHHGYKGLVFGPISKAPVIFYILYSMLCLSAIVTAFLRKAFGWLMCNVLLLPVILILLLTESLRCLKYAQGVSVFNISIILSSLLVIVYNNKLIYKNYSFFRKDNFLTFILLTAVLVVVFWLAHMNP